jgi:MFS family permease
MTKQKVALNGANNNVHNNKLDINFKRLFFSSLISSLGDGVSMVAFPLLAAAHGVSAFQIGLIAAFRTLPWLVFSIPVGVIIDKCNMKKLMLFANAIRTFICLLVLFFIFIDFISATILMIFAGIIGTLEVVFDTSNQTFIPKIVSKDLLTQANSRQQTVELILNKFVGAPVGGFLSSYSLYLTFSVMALCFLIPIILTNRIIVSDNDSGNKLSENSESIMQEMFDGMKYVFNHKIMRIFAVNTAIANICVQAGNVVFVLFITKDLAGPSWAYGFLTAMSAIGGITGVAIIDRFSNNFGKSIFFRSLIVLFPCGMFLIPSFMNLWFIAIGQFFVGLCLASWDVLVVSYRQSVVPMELMGRVNAFYRLMAWGALPVGSLFGGTLAGIFGFTNLYFILGSLLIIPFIFLPYIKESKLNTI